MATSSGTTVTTPDSAMGELLAGALAGRYAVEGEIAHGGMATVFLAREAGSDRPVAIKVMHPRLAAMLGAERFTREIAVVRGMSHPHIVPLYDSGAAAGLLYYVMPYVQGETLHERLHRERRLPLAEALATTRDVAAALGYAHGLGVLHRDVKPENILLAGDHALVADFGLSRAIGAEYTRLTRTGMIMGTVLYMSPEQLREEPNLDQRADIYSLGCLLYEMLAGEPPYAAMGLKELVARILQAPVPSVHRLCATVPPRVEAAISRALAKEAAKRFGSAEEFVAALGE